MKTPFWVLLALVLGFQSLSAAKPSATNSPSTTFVPEMARQLASRGEHAFSKGNFKEAESLYQQALEFGPNSPSILVSFAATETRLGKLSESDSLLRKALRVDLNNGSAWLLLGMNALAQKRDEESVADLVQATYHDPNNPRTHNYLGIAAGRKGWSDTSEQELRRAVELDPTYADANFNLAVLYLRRTPPLLELAHRHYQRALDLGAAHDPLIEAQLAKVIATPSAAPAASAPLP